MNNIPPSLRKYLAADPFYKKCARQEALHDHVCQDDPLRLGKLIEWEHAIYFKGRQLQKKFAIVPLCWFVHSGPGLDKHINEWIALNRASKDELLAISKAIDYFHYRQTLNDKYGVYKPVHNE